MSSLNSQLSTAPDFPHLLGSANIAVFMKALTDTLAYNYGTIGQNILNKTATTLTNPGPCPHYDDERLNPRTLLPIPDTRKYVQVNRTAEQIDLGLAFDDSILELTAASATALTQDVAAWRRLTDNYNRDLDKYRTQDDTLLEFIITHITKGALEILIANPLMVAFRALPATTITRSSRYIHIINTQFAHGNSTVSINELTKFLALTQGPVSTDPTAAFCNRVMDQYSRVLPLLSHAPNVEALTLMLLSMVFIKGLNKGHPPSLRALEIHVQTYPGDDSLDHFDELRARVLASQDSDISNIIPADMVSEHSSAFIAVSTPSTAKPAAPPKVFVKGLKKANRTDHCPYCLSHFKAYYYHAEAACFKKQQGITATTSSSTRRAPNSTPQHSALAAHLDAPPAAPPPATQLTRDQLISFLAAQGVTAHFDDSSAPSPAVN